ncbi:MAG: tetratricopeptide repeat protein, partial [Flavobacteriaceae bacterium]|nr:tetratricopeptide repeat protein [Flavobacteriaceae bacterium]
MRSGLKTKSVSRDYLGRGLVSIQSGVYTLTIADRDALYRKARDDYDRITVDGSSSGWGDVWTPEELIELRSAFETFKQLAIAGYGKTYFPISIFYLGGQGITEDQERARYYAKMAFDWCYSNQLQNDPEIWNDLGTLYRLGRRIAGADLRDDDTSFRYGDATESDYEQAIFWYWLAADTGFSPAMFNLCDMYEYGYGVEQDFEQAQAWQIKAAESGHIQAQYGLGMQYEHGNELVEQDDEQAFYWYLQAAERGLLKAIYYVAEKSWNGYGFPAGDELAFDWYLKQAEQGQVWAQWFLGDAYRHGRGIGPIHP